MSVPRRVLIVVVKWFWLLGVLVAAAYFAHRSWPKIQLALSHMSISAVLGALALTVAAKFVLGENARLAAARCGIDLGYGSALRMYNLSQLGKYMPGSIWQFVGRAVAYRERGAAFGAIRDSLLVESLWTVLSALLLGSALVGGGVALRLLRANASASVIYWLASLAILAALCLIAGVFWRRHTLMRYLRLLMPNIRVLLVQAVTWLLLGTGFWLVAIGTGVGISPVYAVGLFALGFALGFMVPIAPAGLGIRDGILVLGLLQAGTAQDAIVVSVVARVVYLVAEVGLVGVQELALLFAKRRQLHTT